MAAIDVVSDASVALKWFHSEGEQEVAESRALIEGHKERSIALTVLDLTTYEVGNALLRGRARASAEKVAIVLEALAAICPAVKPVGDEARRAAELAEKHGLSLYDAAYAAVAEAREAVLVTLDADLLESGLGVRPSELAARIDTEREARRQQ